MVAGVAVLVGIGRPVDRLGDERGGSVAAEDPQRVDLRCRRDAGAELQSGRERIVAARVGGPVGVDAAAREAAGDVGTVPAALVGRAVHRVGVRARDRGLDVARVVVVADEVEAADHGGVRVEHVARAVRGLEVPGILTGRNGVVRRRACREQIARGPAAAEGRMDVVDAAVEHADADPLAEVAAVGQRPGRGGAGRRHAVVVAPLGGSDRHDRAHARDRLQPRDVARPGEHRHPVVGGADAVELAVDQTRLLGRADHADLRPDVRSLLATGGARRLRRRPGRAPRQLCGTGRRWPVELDHERLDRVAAAWSGRRLHRRAARGRWLQLDPWLLGVARARRADPGEEHRGADAEPEDWSQ